MKIIKLSHPIKTLQQIKLNKMVTLVGTYLLIVEFASAMICFELLLNYSRVVIIKTQNYIQNKPKLYIEGEWW